VISTDRTALAVQSGPLRAAGTTELDLCVECVGRLKDFLAALEVDAPKCVECVGQLHDFLSMEVAK
jgi:hypothetical protein